MSVLRLCVRVVLLVLFFWSVMLLFVVYKKPSALNFGISTLWSAFILGRDDAQRHREPFCVLQPVPSNPSNRKRLVHVKTIFF